MTIDDALFAELRAIAHRDGVSLKHATNRLIRRGLEAEARGIDEPRYECPVFDMGAARLPDPDKALTFSAALEDKEIARKLALRK